MNFLTIFLITFIIAFFLVLVRESDIDLKLEYVPNNIIIEAFVIAIPFLLLASLLSKDFYVIINGVISFGIIFLSAFIIGITGYIKAKLNKKREKKEKNKVENINVIKKDELDIENKTKKKNKFQLKNSTRNALLYIYIVFICFIITSMQAYYNKAIMMSILLIIAFLSFYLYKRKERIEHSIFAIGYGLIFAFAISKIFANTGYGWQEVIIGCSFGIGLEFIVYRAFKRFYENGGYLVDDKGFALPLEQQPKNIQEEEEVVFAIGGGDLILFAAMSLILGLQGVLTVFINAAFVFFAMLIGFKIYGREKLNLLPFVPAITIGYMMYFTDLNIVSLNNLMQAITDIVF